MAARGLGKGLGKGLDALIPNTVETKKEKIKKEKVSSEQNKESERTVKITMVEPNREQPRKNFDEDSLIELAESIKQFGLLQPILVQDRKTYFEIVAGERRWRAAKIAGLKEVPVIVRDLTEQEIVEISLIENIQRENLNPIEEAMAYKRLLTEFDLKQDEVAERVSKSRTAVTNSMRLLKLCDEVQQMIIDDMITTGHARALISIEDKEQQYAIAQKIFDEKLENFLLHIFNQPLEKAYRRGFGQWRCNIEKRYKKAQKARQIVNNFANIFQIPLRTLKKYLLSIYLSATSKSFVFFTKERTSK